MSFHIVRYYLALFILTGFLFYRLWFLCFAMLLIASSVDYAIKRPRLTWPQFLLYYALDHISYQLGVFIGCVRAKTFGSYVPHFVRK